VKRVHVLVEGQTEETFVRDVLSHHFLALGLAPVPILVATKRVKSGGKFKGGVTSYEKQVRGDLQLLLGDGGVAAVTTMIDFYALPNDFPGKASLPQGGTCYDRVAYLERAFRDDIDHRRFLPYLSLHEFEALVLVSPEEVGRALTGQPSFSKLEAEIAGYSSPEEVNDGPETHPAARICRIAPGYQKRLHGPTIALRIGLDAIRRRCPHFDAWVRRLEELAGR